MQPRINSAEVRHENFLQFSRPWANVVSTLVRFSANSIYSAKSAAVPSK